MSLRPWGMEAAPAPAPGPGTGREEGAGPVEEDRARVVLALRLGWWLADAFHQVRCPDPELREGAGRPAGVPPGKLSNFTEMPVPLRLRMYLDGVDVALADLARPTRTGPPGAGRPVPETGPLRARLAAGEPLTPDWSSDLLVGLDELNLEVLRWTMATDPRIGRGYRLGRSLADTARGCDRDPLLPRFTQRQAEISRWLAELATLLPPYSAGAVRRSLAAWTRAVRTAAVGTVPPGEADLAALRAHLRDQGERWRSVLTGGLDPRDLLDEDDWALIARNLVIRDRRLVVEATRGIFVPVLLPLIAALLVVVGVSAVAASGSPLTRAAVALLGLGAGLAALWRTVSHPALAVAGEVNRPLVDSELTVRMADRLSGPLHRARTVTAARRRWPARSGLHGERIRDGLGPDDGPLGGLR